MLKKVKLLFFTAVGFSIMFEMFGEGESSKANNVVDDKVVFSWPVKNSTIVSKSYSANHLGIDIVSEEAISEVDSTLSGIVIAVRDNCQHSYQENDKCNDGKGNYVMVEHDDGTVASYWHLKYASIEVKEGDRIEEGDKIGLMGASGATSDCHLHFQVNYTETKTINTNQDIATYAYPHKPRYKETVNDKLWVISNDGGINFRSAPGTDSKIIGFLNNGTEVEVTETAEVDGVLWGKTTYDGEEGWFSLKYSKNCKQTLMVRVKKEMCLVRYDANGGNSRYDAIQVEKGDVFGRLESPTKEGYKFVGWYTKENGGNEIKSNYTVNSNMTIYAHWTK